MFVSEQLEGFWYGRIWLGDMRLWFKAQPGPLEKKCVNYYSSVRVLFVYLRVYVSQAVYLFHFISSSLESL